MTTQPKPPVEEMTNTDVAKAIHARLRKMEADPEWNATDSHGLSRLYGAGAYDLKNGWISICYVSYQGSSKLEADQARDYLEWLREGNRGRHYTAMQAGKIRKTKRQQLEGQRKVEYSVGYRYDVHSAIELPEEGDGDWMPAVAIEEGDRIFCDAKWFKVTRVNHEVPPEPEELRSAAVAALEAARRDDWETVGAFGRQLWQKASPLRDGRMPEVQLRLGQKTLWLTEDCIVAVKRA